MTEIIVENISKRFKNFEALKKISFKVSSGDFFAILGPSGSGKTTLLRILSGIERPDEGRIIIDEEVVVDVKKKIFVPPQRRKVGMVFQSWALYPNMKAYDNIAFPLRVMGLSKEEIEKRVKEVANVLGISDVLEKYPSQLSGGQQQRVALARALVKQPKLLLLDEPFSNLDARIRITAREYVKKIQRELGITTILVTHDQADAFAVGDKIMVIRSGVIVQIGTPQELYEYPMDLFVADFIGEPPMNIIKISREDPLVKILNIDPKQYEEDIIYIGFRPGDIEILKESEKCIETFIEHSEYQGVRNLSIGNIVGERRIKLVTEKFLKPGERICIKPIKIHIFNHDGRRIDTIQSK